MLELFDQHKIQQIDLINSQNASIELILEPEGNSLIIPPQVQVRIEVTGSFFPIGLEYREDNLVLIYGGLNTVYFEDVEIYPENKHKNWHSIK